MNLGVRYVFSGKPKEAVDAISDVRDASPYGLMVRASIFLLAAMQRDDKVVVAEQLDYMRVHRSDAVGAYQDVLLYFGDMDAAEALLIERLRNEAWRSEALSDVQHYAEVPREALQQGVHERRLELAARPAVIAEIAKVGRVLTVNLAPPFG